MGTSSNFTVALRIYAGRHHYTNEYLRDQLLLSTLTGNYCDGCEEGFEEDDPPAHPYPFQPANLMKCPLTRELLKHFVEPLVEKGAGSLPYQCFREREFAVACPQLVFVLEYGNSEEDYPLRQFFRDGKRVAVQKMSLQWNDVVMEAAPRQVLDLTHD